MSSISPEELQRRLNGGDVPFMLDVREPEEMEDGVIPGSVNIPMGDVKERLGELPTDRDIVVICHLGQRSAYITTQLKALGYDRAVNLSGGVDAWLRQRANGQLTAATLAIGRPRRRRRLCAHDRRGVQNAAVS